MNKTTIILLIFLGLFLMAIGLTKASFKCPQEKVVYRYIPRSFDEEQNEPVYVSEIFKSMFEEQSPWIGNINDLDTRKKESINKYFVSQI